MRLVGLPATDDDHAMDRAEILAAIEDRGSRATRVTVDFGDDDTTATGAGFASWVTADAALVCVPDPVGGPDHSAEDAAVEGVTAVATYLVPGVGFDLVASCPGGTWGRYTFVCRG